MFTSFYGLTRMRLIVSIILSAVIIGQFGSLSGGSVVHAASAQAVDTTTAKPLSNLLRADGSLDTRSGYTGSIDVSGYTMRTGVDGTPHFSPIAPLAAGDERWSARFGIPGINQSRISAMAIAPNGNIIVGGDFETIATQTVNHIARWDGVRWYPLGTGLTLQPLGWVNQIIAKGNDVYVVGDITKAGSTAMNKLARWNGSTWLRVGNGTGPSRADGDEPALYSIAFFGGQLHIGGRFTKMDGVAANNIARWTGSAWAPIGRGIGAIDWGEQFTDEGTVYTLAVNGTNLYVGGSFGVAGPRSATNIAIWNGSSWTAMGSGVGEEGAFSSDQVHAIAFSGTTVFAGGRFEQAGATTVNNIAVWNGSAWNKLGDGVQGSDMLFAPVMSIVVNANAVLVGGNFEAAGGKPRLGLAKWNINTQTWLDAGAALNNRFDSDARVEQMALTSDGAVIVAGAYESVGTLFANNIARLRGSAWETLGDGIGSENNRDPGTIREMTVDANGRVYVSGKISFAGGLPITSLAMWDGKKWSNYGTANGEIEVLLAVGNILYVGGDFTTIDGVAVAHLAQRNLTTGKWFGVGGGMDGEVKALTYSGGLLYAGGNFKKAGNVTAYDVAYWNGTKWSPFGKTFMIYEINDDLEEAPTWVNSLVVTGDMVYIGGYFQTVYNGGDVLEIDSFRLVNNVAIWKRSNDGWFYVGKLGDNQEEPGVTSDNESGPGTEVYSMVLNGTDLYIGGDFNQAGLVRTKSIVRYNTTTFKWSTLGTGMGGVDTTFDPNAVWSLALRGTDLFVAGHFTKAGAKDARFVARWDLNTSSWQTLGSGLSWYNDNFAYAYTLGVGTNALYVGGTFSRAAGLPSSSFAQYTLDPAQKTVAPAAQPQAGVAIQ